jgi:hypothetical protein
VTLQYNADTLYIAATVVDDAHANEQTEDTIWLGDGIQLSFDMANNGGTGYDGTDDYEYGFALTAGGEEMYRWAQPTGSPDPSVEFAIVRDEGMQLTHYEIAIPVADLDVVSLPSEDSAINWIINENDDGVQRRGWLELAPGIGFVKSPEDFVDLSFAAMPDGMDAGVCVPEYPDPDAGAGDAGVDADAGVDVDASVDGG